LDLLHQQRVIDHGPPTPVVHFLALVVQARTISCIQEIAPTLTLADRPLAGHTNSPATRQQVHEIIRELMDDGNSHRTGARAWYFDRMDDLHVAGSLRSEYHADARLLGPMHLLDCVRSARIWGRIATAAAQPNWPAAASQVPPDDSRSSLGDYSILELATRVLSILYLPNLRPRVRDQYHALADRRMAAIGLAVRLYHGDHDGRYPGSLDELVPEYLPAIPADPMAEGSRPIMYRPSANAPIIYSVGDNGKDDYGTTKPGADRWSGSDAVFPLGPTTRSAPVNEDSGSPATQKLPRP
jgi:hypothetical protein